MAILIIILIIFLYFSGLAYTNCSEQAETENRIEFWKKYEKMKTNYVHGTFKSKNENKYLGIIQIDKTKDIDL